MKKSKFLLYLLKGFAVVIIILCIIFTWGYIENSGKEEALSYCKKKGEFATVVMNQRQDLISLEKQLNMFAPEIERYGREVVFGAYNALLDKDLSKYRNALIYGAYVSKTCRNENGINY